MKRPEIKDYQTKAFNFDKYASDQDKYIDYLLKELKRRAAGLSDCCGSKMIKFNTYGYNECLECGKTYRI